MLGVVEGVTIGIDLKFAKLAGKLAYSLAINKAIVFEAIANEIGNAD